MFLENGDPSLLCSVSPAACLTPGSKEWYFLSCVVKWLEPQIERAAAYLSFASNMLCLCKSLSFWVENPSFFLCKTGGIKPVPSLFQKSAKKMNLRAGWWGMCRNPLAWKNPLRSQGVHIAIIIWFPNGESASRDVLCLMNQYILSPPLMNLGIEYLSSWNNWHILVKRLYSSDEILESYWEQGERHVTWEQYCFMDLYLGY